MKAKSILLSAIALNIIGAMAQAEFSGNVKDISNKKGISDVKLMVITDADTTYYKPDREGNFNFKNKAGKTRIYAVGSGYVSEINAVNTTNGSKNTMNIAMVPSKSVDYSYEKRAAYDAAHFASYKQVLNTVNRKSCALPGLTPERQKLPISGLLTAAEVNDFAQWGFCDKLRLGEFGKYAGSWKFVMASRIPIQLKLHNNTPVVDAIVDVRSPKGELIWTSRTDNTGKAELWPDAFHAANKFDKYTIEVKYSQNTYTFDIVNQNEIQLFEINAPCAISDNLDIAFAVDATGSMGDEINFIKNDLDTFIKQFSKENAGINIRLGSVFYRDYGDEYLIKTSPFSSNSSVTDNFILDQRAGGGGDYPEALPEALAAAADSLEWSETARARLLFLVLDAPAHTDSFSIQLLKSKIERLAARGVRVVPIICSGFQKHDEAFTRYLALATNGTNVYLTNNNLTGNTHIEPSADHYKVETLSELLNRIARQFSVVPECDNQVKVNDLKVVDSLLYSVNPNGDDDTSFRSIKNAIWKHHLDSVKMDSLAKIGSKDSIRVISRVEHSFFKFFPNPTSGKFKISCSADIKIVYLADVGGKLLQKIELNAEGITDVDISRYSSGIYFLKYPTQNGWGAERIILQK